MQKTILYEDHLNAQAKMVEFCGWSMPIQYTNIIKEHTLCRTSVALFDICHMGRFIIQGTDALTFLQKVLPTQLATLQTNQSKYSFILNEVGRFIDDIIVTKRADDCYSLIVNAANKDNVAIWLDQKNQTQLKIQDQTYDFGHIAIQGQNAVQVINEIASEDITDLQYYYGKRVELDHVSCYCSRLGYTGEDGFELILPRENTSQIWNSLLKVGEKHQIGLAGLGARDILRLEASMALYGNDIDATRNPIEAALSWAINFQKEEYFLHKLLNDIKNQGVKQRLIAFKMNGKGIPRKGYPIFDATGKNQIGQVTSGTHSPSLHIGIGFAYVEKKLSKIGTPITVQQRDKLMPATIFKKPFVNNTLK